MECAVHVWPLGCQKFPAGLKFNSSESEEASRKRGLGMEFHLSTMSIPCDKLDSRHGQLQCARLNFPHRRLTFVIGFFGPGPACGASHILELEKALELMVKRRSSN